MSRLFWIALLLASATTPPEQTYDKGVALRKSDPARACDYFEDAATHGLVTAQYSIGRCYHLADGRPRSLDTAVRWYTMAAEQGEEKAMLALVNLRFFEGIESVPDELANRYLRTLEGKLDDVEDREDQNRIAMMLGAAYHDGRVVQRNDRTAVAFFRRSASLGGQLSMAILVEVYSGRGAYAVPSDMEQALYWKGVFEQYEAQRALAEGRDARSLESAVAYLRRRGIGLGAAPD